MDDGTLTSLFTSFTTGSPNTVQSGLVAFDANSYFGPFGDQSGVMTFGLVAGGAGSGSLQFNLSTSAQSYFTALSPVPEPAVPVQLLIGFTALAGFGLRRLRGVQS